MSGTKLTKNEQAALALGAAIGTWFALLSQIGSSGFGRAFLVVIVSHVVAWVAIVRYVRAGEYR